jgi:hypothetical protein
MRPLVALYVNRVTFWNGALRGDSSQPPCVITSCRRREIDQDQSTLSCTGFVMAASETGLFDARCGACATNLTHCESD